MAYPPNYQHPDVGGLGWFYISVYDRSRAWVWVDSLYNFILDIEPLISFSAGPYGIAVPDRFYLEGGDIIQYEWDGDNSWDHSVIVVKINDPEYNYIPLVASHGIDEQFHDNYPYTAFDYDNVRFIRIKYNRGKRIFLQIISRNFGSTANLMQNPYPSPMDLKVIQPAPYPVPLDTNIEQLAPYPAP